MLLLAGEKSWPLLLLFLNRYIHLLLADPIITVVVGLLLWDLV